MFNLIIHSINAEYSDFFGIHLLFQHLKLSYIPFFMILSFIRFIAYQITACPFFVAIILNRVPKLEFFCESILKSLERNSHYQIIFQNLRAQNSIRK